MASNWALTVVDATATQRPPAYWTYVADIVQDVAEFLPAQSLCRFTQTCLRIREACDDRIWRVLCRLSSSTPPRPFASFQHYYRSAMLQLPVPILEGLFGPLIGDRVTRNGNITRRALTAAGCLETGPICRVLRRKRLEVLLLDRAEQIYIGLGAHTHQTASDKLSCPRSHHLFPTSFCLPGMVLSLTTSTRPSRLRSGQTATFFTATQVEHNFVMVDEELPPEVDSSWTFAFALGAPGASFAVLNFEAEMETD